MKAAVYFIIFALLGAIPFSQAVSPAGEERYPFDAMRNAMVEYQLKGRDIRDERVLAVMRKVPRHLFVPEILQVRAYDDRPLPIGHDQTISQPYIVAYMTQLLGVEPGDKVLEIGTGSGYQAAVLAELAAEVYSIEIVEPLYHRAGKILGDLGYKNIRLKLGNGWLGWPEHAPFDKIMVTAAPDQIPQRLVDQLKEGGKIIVPVGSVYQKLIVGVKEGGTLRQIETIPVRFVPLVQKPQEEG